MPEEVERQKKASTEMKWLKRRVSFGWNAKGASTLEEGCRTQASVLGWETKELQRWMKTEGLQFGTGDRVAATGKRWKGKESFKELRLAQEPTCFDWRKLQRGSTSTGDKMASTGGRLRWNDKDSFNWTKRGVCWKTRIVSTDGKNEVGKRWVLQLMKGWMNWIGKMDSKQR
jgi:hypothetical protein